MTSILDDFFPRDTKAQRRPRPAQPPNVQVIEGPRWGANYTDGAPVKPTRRRDPNKPTAKDLERIGEGLTKYLLKKVGLKLTKIPLIENYYGYTSQDVDFRDEAHRLKVEAKAWWLQGGKNNFPVRRVSTNERRYLNAAIATGWQAWVTIALLDTLPTRKACNTFYVIPWRAWLQIEVELLKRAGGNYKGKSLRVRDLDLLEGYAIVREGRRWVIPAGHWLNEEVER